MTAEPIRNRLTDILKDVLDNDSIELSRDTTAADLEGWDSLAHINIIVAVEKEFKIRFDLMDIKPLKNVGEFLDLIQRKIS